MSAAELKFRKLPVSSLKLANYNPKRRLEGAKIKMLQKSIENIGLVYPIAVNQDSEVIDGHRRVAACKRLGWEEVPVVIVSGNRQEIYADVNANTVRMNGNDILNIWLSEPSAVPQRTRRYLETVETAIGRALMIRIAKRGASIVYYRWAKEIAAYCERADDVPFVCRTVRWFLKHKTAKAGNAAIRVGVAPRVIERAVLRNQRLVTTFKASK